MSEIDLHPYWRKEAKKLGINMLRRTKKDVVYDIEHYVPPVEPIIVEPPKPPDPPVTWDRTIEAIPDGVQTMSKMPNKHIEPLYPKYSDRGKGAYVYSGDKEYIDYPCGLGAILLGYSDDRVNKAVSQQLSRGSLFSLPNKLETKLAEKLIEIIPCAEQVRFLKTGSEATSAAVRIARASTGRDGIVACYDSETEILTKDGFKKFDDIAEDEVVATLNPETNNLEYHQIQRKIKYHHNGKMVHFKGKSLDLMVTPDHKIYRRFKRGDGSTYFKTEDAQNRINKKTFTQMTTSCNWNCSDIETVSIPSLPLLPASRRNGMLHKNTISKGITKFPIDLFVRFMGWYLSEGSCVCQERGRYEVVISQSEKNKQKSNEVFSIIEQMGFKAHRNGHHIVFSSKEMVKYLSQFGHCRDKHIPYWLKQLPPKRLILFIDAIIKGDGTFENGNIRKFYSTSSQLIDDMQEVLLKSGYSSTVKLRTSPSSIINGRHICSGEIYHLSIATNEYKDKVKGGLATEVDYNGHVHCVTVTNHIVLVRRNGRIVWSGNCGYHGWHDWYGITTDNKKGIPCALSKLAGQCNYGDREMITEMFSLSNVVQKEIAAIILEPYIYDVQPEFLEWIVRFAHNNGALVIFDEVVTGFRTKGFSAQKMFNVTPDLACFGKAMANGVPISVVCGKEKYMSELRNGCFVSSTFGGDLIGISAALATIEILEQEPVIEHIWSMGQKLKDGFNEISKDLPDTRLIGQPCRTFFEMPSELHKSLLWQECIKKDILFGYAQFINYSHGEKEIDRTLDVLSDACKVLRDHWDEPHRGFDAGVKAASATFRHRR